MNRRSLVVLLVVPAAALFLFFGPKGPRDQSLRLRSRRAPVEIALSIQDDSGDLLREAHLRGERETMYAFRATDGRYRVHIDVNYGDASKTFDKEIVLDGSTIVLQLPDSILVGGSSIPDER
jgi:hypothetical protein